jgi:selenide,water dikinase
MKEISAFAMRCGGCGAKVGATVLSRRAGRDLAPAERDDVVIGLDAPDDAGRGRTAGPGAVPDGGLLPRIVDDPYLFGKDRGTHASGDVYAHGRGAADGAGDRQRALRHRGQGRGRPVAHDGRR